jgi:DNA-binding response OmpR family regulator
MREAVILLVEDNERINIANKDMLELLGYETHISETLAAARALLEAITPDVIVLDIMLPDGSGLNFLKELRESRKTASIPVVLLTALGTPENVANGLDVGADDYVSKPYDYKVLAARIKVILRHAGTVNERLKKGPLELEIIASRAKLGDEDLLLNQKEFALLLLLAQNENRIMSSEELYEAVWRRPHADDTSAVRTTVSRLRGKLAGTGYTISSKRDTGGYIFQPEEI